MIKNKINLIEYADILKIICPSISHLDVTAFETLSQTTVQYAVKIEKDEHTYQLNIDNVLARLNDALFENNYIFKFYPNFAVIKEKAEIKYRLNYLKLNYQRFDANGLLENTDKKLAKYCHPEIILTEVHCKTTALESILKFYKEHVNE